MPEDLKANDKRYWQPGQSFQVHKLDWKIVWLALILLAGFFVAGELFFRMDPVQAALTPPRLGSRHRQFEIQVGRLDRLVNNGEMIDCIFLGNSMTWLGVDPLIVDRTFESQTGEKIHCFNFGVSALPASSAGLIAPMLVERYHPKLLIYGTFARDYAIPSEAEDADVIASTPWLAYQLGDLSAKGWAYQNLHVLQYKGHMRSFLQMNTDDLFIDDTAPAYEAYGLDPKLDIRIDVTQPPELEASDNRDPVRWLTHFTIYPEDLDGLRRVVEQSTGGTQVIVIEMPVYKTALEFFPNREQDYQSYLLAVEQITASNGTIFWQLDDQLLLTPENWWDYFHLNLSGVNIFSEWLGRRLAEGFLQNELHLSTAE